MKGDFVPVCVVQLITEAHKASDTRAAQQQIEAPVQLR